MTVEWVIVIIATVLGIWSLKQWWLNRRFVRRNLPRDYLVGLNFLLNEEPDKAVDVFIKMLEVDSETVETHLALAKLFRRRGEVERAIRIHQNLIARPDLDKIYKEQSLFELGQDYLSAGMLDRAERIFLELVETKEFSTLALKALLDIYQQEKMWEKSVQIASKLAAINKHAMRPVIAHQYCELAEMVFAKEQYEEASQYAKKALAADQRCVRANLLLAKVEIHKSDYRSALKNLKKIKDQNSDYLSEAIEPLAVCYEMLGEGENLVSYLKKILQESPRIPVVLILSDRIRKWKGDKVAANFVADYVRRYPSLAGLYLFINLYAGSVEGRAKDDLLILQSLIKKLLAEKPNYQCGGCGYSGNTLLWQCPGCKQWESVKPLHSLGS
jgi:lipopolysaccharide biosynthesis regulator YciM